MIASDYWQETSMITYYSEKGNSTLFNALKYRTERVQRYLNNNSEDVSNEPQIYKLNESV